MQYIMKNTYLFLNQESEKNIHNVDSTFELRRVDIFIQNVETSQK